MSNCWNETGYKSVQSTWHFNVALSLKNVFFEVIHTGSATHNPLIHNFVICTLLSRIRGKQPLRGGATESWSCNQKEVTLLELWASHLLHLIIITLWLTPSLWISVVWRRRCRQGRDWGVSNYHRNMTHPYYGHFQVQGRSNYRHWTILRPISSYW